MITQRLSGDNFPSKGSWKFSGGVEGNSLLRYISPNERRCKGFERLSADLSAFGKLSIKLKAVSCKVFTIIQQTLLRHFILVFCAYTFILWHKLTGGLQRRWANRPLNTFVEALEAFRTAMSFRFFEWLTENRDVFAAYKASLGFVWA
jgi:hypothetical protein